MTRYLRSDDGKVVDGKTVVFLQRAVVDAGQGRAPGRRAAAATPLKSTPEGLAPRRASPRTAARTAVIQAQAAMMVEAAKDGVPFCRECEAARKKLLAEASRK
jgi:hypothetical protein